MRTGGGAGGDVKRQECIAGTIAAEHVFYRNTNDPGYNTLCRVMLWSSTMGPHRLYCATRGLSLGLVLSMMLFTSPNTSTMAIEVKKTEVKKPAIPDPKATAAVTNATAALLKEATAGTKDKMGKLREKCDYFVEKPSADLTPEVILIALEHTQSTDRRIEAYVKWQLLSGIAGQFPDELVLRAIAAYRKAPELSSHPGLDRAQLSKSLSRIGPMKRERMGEINSSFSVSADKTTGENLYVLHYRKELYAHLPVSGDSLMAGLEDIFARVQHGVPAGDMWTAVSGSIQSWSLTADSHQLNSVLQAMVQLLSTVRSERAKPYTKLEWSDDPKNLGLHWKDQMSLEDGKVQAMIDSIRESAKMLGEVGFKDKKK